MRFPVLVLCIILLGGASGLAQTGTIRGRIRTLDGDALLGATVRVQGTSRGAVAKADGSYVIEQVSAGKRMIDVSLIGYQTVTTDVVVKANDTVRADVTLRLDAVQKSDVVVVGSRRQPQTDTRPSVQTVSAREAKFRAGAAEDVFRSLQGLPGVTAPSDFSSQLVIRGSGPDQNLILMDGIELFNPYRLYGFISMFNPETVNTIQLMTGGFPAPYSDRLSAVLDVTNRDGDPNKYPVGGKLNMSVTNANLVVEGPLGFWGGSYIVSGRRTYYDLIAGPIAKATGAVEGDVALPNFGDLQARIAVMPAPGHRFVLNGITSRDNTEFQSGTTRDRPDSISLVDKSNNEVVGLTWAWTPTPTFTSRVVASWYRNSGANDFGGQGGSQRIAGGEVTQEEFIRLQDSLRREGVEVPTLFSINGSSTFDFTKQSLRADQRWKVNSSHELEWGFIVDDITTGVGFQLDLDPRLRAFAASNPRSVSFPEEFRAEISFLRTGAWFQDNIRLSEALTIQPGLRYDYFAFIGRQYLSPRLSASYAIDAISTVRAAFGLYYQSPGYEKLFDRQVFLDLTDPSISSLRAESSIHYVLGYERMVTDEWQFRTEAYVKTFDDLILQDVVEGTQYSVERVPGADISTREGWTTPIATRGDSLTARPVNSATGLAYGFEVMLQKVANVNPNSLYGWASYSLAWAERYRDGLTIPFNFDRRHSFNIVGGWRAYDWLDLSVTFTYGSGFPWTDAVGIEPRVLLREDAQTGEKRPELDVDWRGVVFNVDRGGLENLNRARLPDYHRLDIRGTTYASWYGLEWSFYLDIVNVYNRRNIIARNWRVDRETLELEMRETAMLPILPTLGFSVAW